LVYDWSGRYVGEVDFNNKTSADGAITHSGDIHDEKNKSFVHTIGIHLNKLSPEVKSLYFILSAYLPLTTLKDIKDPCLKFTDASTKKQLLQYDWKEKNTEDNTAVILCKLYKETRTSGEWKVLAIGELTLGRAGNYTPLKNTINKLQSKGM